MLLPLIGGCLVVGSVDNRFGRVNSSVLTGRIFKHVRIPYAKHFQSSPLLSIQRFDLDYFLKGDVFTSVGPFKTDLLNTPVKDTQASGIIIHIQEPVSGYGLYTEFNSNAIGDIAKKHGLTKVYFADLEIFNVLGIWTHERLHIYGE